MTGAEINDGYKGLAASIVMRAQNDCKGKIESTAGSDTVKALIQHDAAQWLKSSEWCDCMLYFGLSDYPEYRDVPQEFVARQAVKRRKKSYIKRFSKIDMDAWMPLTALAELTGISRDAIFNAAYEGDLFTIQHDNHHYYSTFTELAITLVAGDLIT